MQSLLKFLLNFFTEIEILILNFIWICNRNKITKKKFLSTKLDNLSKSKLTPEPQYLRQYDIHNEYRAIDQLDHI